MRLTVLDGHALNPGDLSWDAFRKYADLTVYEQTSGAETEERVRESDAVLLNKVPVTSDTISRCPRLKYIGVLATGYNVVDVAAAKKAGVCVTNVPAYSTAAVAQHVFAFITCFSNLVALHDASVRSGGWIRSGTFCYWEKPLTELAGKTLGILGYGNIGRKTAEIARAFGMNVIVCPHTARPDTAGAVTRDELFRQSDFLTLHVPLTPETAEIINRDTLSQMRRGAYLINTARGGLVNERDVRDALDSGRLAGYAADVLASEPMAPDCPLYGAPNCVITPHIAWAPLETRRRLMDTAFRNFERWIQGRPQNTVC